MMKGRETPEARCVGAHGRYRKEKERGLMRRKARDKPFAFLA
jgi:hypothetical protein